MTDIRRFTAMTCRENGGYVALCPSSTSPARPIRSKRPSANVREAVELFLEKSIQLGNRAARAPGWYIHRGDGPMVKR